MRSPGRSNDDAAVKGAGPNVFLHLKVNKSDLSPARSENFPDDLTQKTVRKKTNQEQALVSQLVLREITTAISLQQVTQTTRVIPAIDDLFSTFATRILLIFIKKPRSAVCSNITAAGVLDNKRNQKSAARAKLANNSGEVRHFLRGLGIFRCLLFSQSFPSM